MSCAAQEVNAERESIKLGLLQPQLVVSLADYIKKQINNNSNNKVCSVNLCSYAQ